jgi:hypothetical protein
VRDANGQALSYVYYESEPGRRSAAKLLSKDEARRIATNIAKLPELQAPLGEAEQSTAVAYSEQQEASVLADLCAPNARRRARALGRLLEDGW